ncbi:MAG TPA: hypothetical protein VMF61_07060, partial [Candidatus Acidoferrales bacterium]|nr:hypothetical protein [Candidatus Acidoferrales bacterium]
AYADARFLLEVVAELAARRPHLGAVLSIARSVDAGAIATRAGQDGWSVVPGSDPIPFSLARGQRVVVRAWRGALGPMLRRVELVAGQAGTANEAAAAAGRPVVAFEDPADRKTLWYRKRQKGLLGDATILLPRRFPAAADGVAALLDDPQRRAAMGNAGRARMGPPGGARRIAERAVAILGERVPCVS